MEEARRGAVGRIPARAEGREPVVRRELDPREADRARRIRAAHHRAALLEAPPAASDARPRAVVRVHGADVPGGPRPELRDPHRARGGGRDAEGAALSLSLRRGEEAAGRAAPPSACLLYTSDAA